MTNVTSVTLVTFVAFVTFVTFFDRGLIMALLTILGVTRNQGNYEGEDYNYCTVQAISRMDSSKGVKVGFAGVEFRASPEMWDKLRALVFCDAQGRPGVVYDVEFETVAGRRGASQQWISSVKFFSASHNQNAAVVDTQTGEVMGSTEAASSLQVGDNKPTAKTMFDTKK